MGIRTNHYGVLAAKEFASNVVVSSFHPGRRFSSAKPTVFTDGITQRGISLNCRNELSMGSLSGAVSLSWMVLFFTRLALVKIVRGSATVTSHSARALETPKLLDIPRGGGSDDQNRRRKDNPYWSWRESGGEMWRSQDIDYLVNEILKDPQMNIRSLPDWLERQLYRHTIQITLQALEMLFAEIHGHELLGHRFEMARIHNRRQFSPSSSRASGVRLPGKPRQFSEEQELILEQVAERFITNKYINRWLIPDCLEKKLYKNCLKVVFRVLDLITDSFRLSLCGHDLKISLETTTRTALEQAALRRVVATSKGQYKHGSSPLSEINMERMEELAQELARKDLDRRFFLWRWFSPANNALLAQMHASVYCLILAILDDMLENSEIQILSERIRFDLVPTKVSNNTSATVSFSKTPLAIEGSDSNGDANPGSGGLTKESGNRRRFWAPFLSGSGLGLAIGSLANTTVSALLVALLGDITSSAKTAKTPTATLTTPIDSDSAHRLSSSEDQRLNSKQVTSKVKRGNAKDRDIKGDDLI